MLNLAVNARDAMPNGGTLSISTGKETVEGDLFGDLTSLKEGDYGVISVTDTGTGMRPEVRAHAFEPFFTTKGVGEGTGLGLSMVLGSMQQLGGTARIYSEPGEGTTVFLYLPCPASQDEDTETTEPVPQQQQPRGRERILVVEDNDLIRYSVMAMLRSLGYVVVGAESGDAACSMLDQGSRFDLVFTDVILPGRINGVALAREVLSRRIGMAVLLTSGFANPEQYSDEIREMGLSLLQKPYRKAMLAERIRFTLDQQPEQGQV